MGCPRRWEAIREAAASYLKPALTQARTFKVEARRSDKEFPLKSPDICADVGGCLLEAYPHLRVDVHQPDVVVMVEIRDFGAYVHAAQLPGAGGMPVGTGGRAALLISGGIDSPVAGYMMAKRGIELTCVHFASPPYTSERAEMKVVSLLEQVARYAGRMELHIVPFTHIQEEIQRSCPEELFTLIMAPVHDAAGRFHRQDGAMRRPDYRRKRGAGGQSDHSGPCLHRRGGRHAGVPAGHRHG